MNARELKPIHRALSPYFPGFVEHKRLFLSAPMDGVLRGIHFDPSAFDKVSFYPSSVIMPLCVPSDHLSLMFGHRLRHKTERYAWTADLPALIPDLADAIREQGLPVLAQSMTAEGFSELGKNSRGNPHTETSIAFFHARLGEAKRAIYVIDHFVSALDLSTPWQKDIFDISTRLREMLVADPEAAHRQLLEWEDYTIKKLKLEAFR